MSRGGGSLVERLDILWTFVCLGGAVLGLRLVQLQILESSEYRRLAEFNRTKVIYQTAPRGRIYDRNGVAVATNQPAFSLIYLPSKKERDSDLGFLAEQLARELKLEPQDVLDTLQQAVREETALRLAENLPPRTMFRLSELKTIYPGVDLIVEARRYYPFGPFASHLIGYMGKMDRRSWRTLKTKGYRVDSWIGRIGLEAAFENELRGRDGGLRMEVDAQGRLRRILERMPWSVGSNIHLTLDAAVQKAADEGLRASATRKGAVVAIDPRNGSIRALSAGPDFDPNAFLSSDPEVVKAVVSEVQEFNRAIAGAYAPGSIFKLIVSAAGLNEGRFSLDDSVYCPGYFEHGRDIFLCWEHKGHKRVSWLSGLTQSCDVYFYRMGLKTGGALIEKYARMFGLGTETNIALKGEKRGNLFGPAARAKSGRPWYDGDTINLSIGQGELLVTPVQMAVVVAALANRGTLWRPHYIDRIEYTEGRPTYRQKPEKAGEVSLKPEVWKSLVDGMRLVVSSGTGGGARVSGLDVAGKTGTAQNPSGPDHAWFVAFAARPGEPSEIAVAVLVENGGHGASAAAPIARSVIMAAYGIPEKKPESAHAAVRPGAGVRPPVLGVPAPAAAPAGVLPAPMRAR
ncbi:MAG: penicillin-binding protein 2 [Elusimicrobia bacterium]|nr:penicillin-binding protein 2 [Elusimicrobiota bacterium]